MKNLKLAVLAMALFIGSQVFAGNTNPGSTSQQMVTEIDHLLKDHDFQLSQDLVVEVTFTVNKDNELVVLSVDTKNYGVNKFILNRLNYKKLDFKVTPSVLDYKLPVRIQA